MRQCKRDIKHLIHINRSALLSLIRYPEPAWLVGFGKARYVNH